jgi:hypothetical protein
MTRVGAIRFTVTRRSASIVGKLVSQRAKRIPLGKTPLRKLPTAGDKLLKASRRSGNAPEITLWAFTREEGLALAHWLSFLMHPQAVEIARLRKQEERAVRAICLALAERLLAKPGPARQPEDDAQFTVSADDQRSQNTLPVHVEPPDRAYAARLRKRFADYDQLLGTKLNPIPKYIQILIAKKYR